MIVLRPSERGQENDRCGSHATTSGSFSQKVEFPFADSPPRELHLLSAPMLRTLMKAALAVAILGVHVPAALAQTDSELRGLYDRKEYARIEQYARQGDARAEAWMGLISAQAGRREEAKEWYHRAAEKGNLQAIRHLARAYQYDEKNYEEADRWLRRGAELGDQDMQISLAWRYLHGRGVPKDEREAFRWYLAATRSFSSYAYLATAEMYAAGQGTERDPVEAYAQLEIALKVLTSSETQDLERAHSLQRQLAQELSPEQIREAHRRAHERRPDMVPR